MPFVPRTRRELFLALMQHVLKSVTDAHVGCGSSADAVVGEGPGLLRLFGADGHPLWITSYIFSLALQTAVRLAWAGGSELAQDMAVDVDINLTEHICTWEWSLAEEIFLLTRCDFAWAVSHPLLAATSLLWKATEVCSLPNSTVFIPQLPHPQCITDIKKQYLIYLCYM